MSQPSQNITKKLRTDLDANQVIKDVHIPEANALKTIHGCTLHKTQRDFTVRYDFFNIVS